jgi:hypothetical protein
MKSIDNKLGCGTLFMAYVDCLLIIQIIIGIEIVTNLWLILIMGLIGFPIIFFIGNKLSKNYNEEDNGNKFFYLIITLLIGLCALLGYYIAINR